MNAQAEPIDGQTHFQLCRCGQHGRLVFPDGRTGGELASKEEFRLAMHYGSLVGKFQQINVFPENKIGGFNHIHDEVAPLSLPDYFPADEPYFRKQLNTWNAAKIIQPNLNPDDFHKVMEKLWHYREYDD